MHDLLMCQWPNGHEGGHFFSFLFWVGGGWLTGGALIFTRVRN